MDIRIKTMLQSPSRNNHSEGDHGWAVGNTLAIAPIAIKIFSVDSFKKEGGRPLLFAYITTSMAIMIATTP
jgi:hypothetical protein